MHRRPSFRHWPRRQWERTKSYIKITQKFVFGVNITCDLLSPVSTTPATTLLYLVLVILLYCKICCAVSNTHIIAGLARGDKGNLILDIILYMLSLLALLVLYLAKQVFNFCHNKVLPHCWEHPDPNSFKKRFISGNCVFCVAHCSMFPTKLEDVIQA